MSGLLAKAFRRTKLVEMHEVAFQSFYGDTTAIGTADLRSCLVVLVASRLGGILAHIAPLGEDYTRTMMDRFAVLYRENQVVCFPSDVETWVVSGMVDKSDKLEPTLEHQKVVVDQALLELGIEDGKDAMYKFKLRSSLDSPTFPGKGTVFIDGQGSKAIIYVEDRQVSPA